MSYFLQSLGNKRPEDQALSDALNPSAVPFANKPIGQSNSLTGISALGAASPASQIPKSGNQGTNSGLPGTSTNPATPQTTTGTPSSATGSGLPSYGANWNFNWAQTGAPGANTNVQAPQNLAQMGVNPGAMANYNPTAVTQWGSVAPNQAGQIDPAKAALTGLLSGDASGMDTSAIKNRLKEQRLMMEKDEMGASRQANASRGMLDSGVAGADERRIRSSARGDILGGFRDVDIAAAEAGTRNKLAASGLLDQLLTGELGRASEGYANTLSGEKLQDDIFRYDSEQDLKSQQFALDSALGLSKVQNDAANANLNAWKAGTDATLAGRDQEIEIAKGKTNELLGRMGLAVNLEEISRASSRDKMQFLTDIFDRLVQNEQFNAQMGLNYSQMGQSMNEMMANIAKSIGV